MKIVTPAVGASVSAPLQLEAAVSSACSITTMHVYIDDHLQFAQYSQPVLSGKFNASLGTHNLVVQAWASDGKLFRQAVRVSVIKQTAPGCSAVFDPNVKLCAPANLTEAKGAVRIQASSKSTVSPVVTLKTYASGKLRAVSYNQNAQQIDASLTLPRGLQNINIVARAANGEEFHNETNVQIVSAAQSCGAPFLSNIVPTGGDAPEFPPFLIAADAAACPITSLQVYVDNRLFYTQLNQKLFEGRLTIEPGEHNVVLQARSSQGVISKKALKINVFGLEEPLCVPATDLGVTICQLEPTDNRYVITQVGATPSVITAVRIYVDNVQRATFQNFAAQRGIAVLKMTAGTHTIVAVAWTRDGQVVTSRDTVTVP